MPLTTVSFFRVEDYLRRMQALGKSLDDLNVRILNGMAKHGPRNLLEIVRKLRLPASTVYNRLERLERQFSPLVTANILVSKLGLVRHIVLLQTGLGFEQAAIDALKIPNYWWSLARAEGGYNVHSVQLLPQEYIGDFKRYVAEVKRVGLAEKTELIATTDYHFNWPDFSYFDPSTRVWRFEWRRWLDRVVKVKAADGLRDPEGYDCVVDMKDLLIVKELQRDGRKTFAELSKTIGHTLQAAKFRYDKHIQARGIIRGFELSILPFPHEISDLREFRLEFPSPSKMNGFHAGAAGLPFIRSFSKVLRRNWLIVRTYTPRTESDNLFAFFSELAKRGVLDAYSAIRISMPTLQSQTIPYKLFDEEKEWSYDEKRCITKLRSLSVTVKGP